MFMLKLLLLLVIFTAVKCDIEDKSSCFNAFRVPREGFKMKNCIPGHYEGSCLLLFPKPVNFKEALKTCHFDYGGRLATADSEEVFKKWTKRIYRDPDFQVNNDSRFWIGYGITPLDVPTFLDMKLKGDLVKPFFQMNYWNKAFGKNNFIFDLPWEEEPDFDKLNNFPCGQYATVFNPNNGNFSIRKDEEKHPFLCETPRYPKFKCSSGWHLYPNDRLCIWFESSRRNFRDAYIGCRNINAFPLVTKGGSDDASKAAVLAIFALHNHGLESDRIWSGRKRAEHKMQTLDGSSINIRAVGLGDNFCTAFAGQGYWVPEHSPPLFFSQSLDCTDELPFICQRFVDQAFNLKAE